MKYVFAILVSLAAGCFGQNSNNDAACKALEQNAVAVPVYEGSCQYVCMNGTSKITNNKNSADMSSCVIQEQSRQGPGRCLSGVCVGSRSIQACVSAMNNGDTLQSITETECSVSCQTNKGQRTATKGNGTSCMINQTRGVCYNGQCQSENPRPSPRPRPRPHPHHWDRSSEESDDDDKHNHHHHRH